jgi:hypothetical protein
MKLMRGRLLALGACALIAAAGWTRRSPIRVFLGLPTIDRMRMGLVSRQKESLEGIPRERVMVGLVTGQSNAGNYGPSHAFLPQPRVLNFFSGELYRAKDPLPGSDGLGSTPWIPLGGMLVERGRYGTVVFALAVRGGTSVRQWLPGWAMQRLVAQTVSDLRRAGLPPTHILWQQGETDAHVSRGFDYGSYQAAFHSFLASLRAAGVEAPVYVALATRTAGLGPDPGLRQAQQSLVNAADNVFAGPDADSLGDEFRTDGTHFNRAGLERLAALWYESLNRQ